MTKSRDLGSYGTAALADTGVATGDLPLAEDVVLQSAAGTAGATMLAATTPQEQRDLIGAGRKNLIINGAMQVSQRGDYSSATVSTGDNYSLDRWQSAGNGSTDTVQLTSTGYLKRNMPSAGSFATYIQQQIEGANSYLIGKPVTISGKCNTNSLNLRLWIFEGGSWVNKGSITGDFSITFTYVYSSLPNIPIRFAVSDVASPNTYVSVAANEHFEIKEVQLELSSVATDFEHRSYGEELALCQRYYWQTDNTGGYSNVIAQDQAFRTQRLDLPVTMRSAPSVTHGSVAGTWTGAPDAIGSSTSSVFFQWNYRAASQFMNVTSVYADAEIY
jgi:hypothetical protein